MDNKLAIMAIPLTQGLYALVDGEDYEELNQFKWSFSQMRNLKYAMRGSCVGGKRKTIYMHRQILNPPHNIHIDHDNGCGLDNRRANLRLATSAQNLWNQRKITTAFSSKYKGISWVQRDKRWRVSIMCNGKRKYIGSFVSEADAAKAYNEVAQKYYGKFARLNDV